MCATNYESGSGSGFISNATLQCPQKRDLRNDRLAVPNPDCINSKFAHNHSHDIQARIMFLKNILSRSSDKRSAQKKLKL